MVEIALEADRAAGLGPGEDGFVAFEALGALDDRLADKARRRLTDLAGREARHETADTRQDRLRVSQRERAGAAFGNGDDIDTGWDAGRRGGVGRFLQL